MSAQFSGEGFADMYFNVDAVAPEKFSQWVDATHNLGAELNVTTYAELAKPSAKVRHSPIARSRPPVQQHPGLRNAVRRCDVPQLSDINEGGKMNFLAGWTGVQFPSTNPSSWVLRRRCPVHRVDPFVGRAQGLRALFCGGMDYLRRPQAHRHHVHNTALIMLLRGFADAIMMRAQQAVAAGGAQDTCRLSTSTRLLGARHDHDLFHGDALRDRNDEFRGAAATRRPRHGVSDLELGGPGPDRLGILLINISLAVGEFAKTGWVAYPPLSERNSRLVSASIIILVASDFPASARC